MCSKCKGRGGFTTSQNHPWGSTYATEYLFEPCEYCVNKGLCPSCDGPITEDEEWKCLDSECGATYDSAQKMDSEDYGD